MKKQNILHRQSSILFSSTRSKKNSIERKIEFVLKNEFCLWRKKNFFSWPELLLGGHCIDDTTAHSSYIFPWCLKDQFSWGRIDERFRVTGRIWKKEKHLNRKRIVKVYVCTSYVLPLFSFSFTEPHPSISRHGCHLWTFPST